MRLTLPAVVVLTLLSGCTGPTTQPGAPPHMDDNPVVYDLTVPPSREQLGYQPGERGLAVGRPAGGQLLDVTVLLPGGKQLHAKAFRVDSTSAGVAMVPDNLNIYTISSDAKAAEKALTEAAPILSLPEKQVGYGRKTLTEPPNALGTGTGTGIELRGSKLDYLSPGLGLRRNDPNNAVTVTYRFFWGELMPPVSPPSVGG